MFWGVFRNQIDTAKLLEGQMKDKPIVTGAYAKWLANHSVQKDTLDPHIAVYKSTKEIKSLNGDMVSQAYLRAVRALADSSKKLVDKALATKKWLQVWWGRS